MRNKLYINVKLDRVLNSELIQNLKKLKRDECYSSLDVENELKSFQELYIDVDDMYNIYIDSLINIEDVEKEYIDIEEVKKNKDDRIYRKLKVIYD